MPNPATDDTRDRKEAAIMSHHDIIRHLRGIADPAVARVNQTFFKTAAGEYGHGDVFLGIRIPTLRGLVKQWKAVEMPHIIALLHSELHEARMLALLLMVDRFSGGDQRQRASIYEAYLSNTAYINNWDLVDCSAYQIVGPWLFDQDRAPLYALAQSPSLWERRIAIVSTLHLIRHHQLQDTFALATALLQDPEDLIHKATGWMLREAGKRDLSALEGYLQQHYPQMPRTMLRYAIEKLTPARRQAYLKGTL
jgi:3-methyladenine DNA glycosylase AlkD